MQRARVDTEVRALADDVSSGLARPWAPAIRRASVSRLDDLSDRLDGALAATDLGVARIPGWAGLVRVLQWLLILTALVGRCAGSASLAVMDYLQAAGSRRRPSLAGSRSRRCCCSVASLLGVLLALRVPGARRG